MRGHRDRYRWAWVTPHRHIGQSFLSWLLVVSSCLLVPAAIAGESLDRLFFFPDDRAYLEKLRWASSPLLAFEPNQQDNPEVTEDKPQLYTLGGTVTKKSGMQVLWLNGLKYSRGDLPSAVRLHSPFRGGQIRLRVPETRTSYTVRAGQTLDINSGRIREPYEPAPAAAVEAQSGKTPATATEPPSGPVQIPQNSEPLKP